MGIEPAKIPSRRDRLVVSPERREEARAGMGGSKPKWGCPLLRLLTLPLHRQ